MQEWKERYGKAWNKWKALTCRYYGEGPGFESQPAHHEISPFREFSSHTIARSSDTGIPLVLGPLWSAGSASDSRLLLDLCGVSPPLVRELASVQQREVELKRLFGMHDRERSCEAGASGCVVSTVPQDGVGNPVSHGARRYTSVGKNVSELWGGSMDVGHAQISGALLAAAAIL